MSKGAIVFACLVCVGIGAAVQEWQQDQREPEVVHEEKIVDRPVMVYQTETKTVTAPAPPAPEKLPESCAKIMSISEELFRIMEAYSTQSGRLSEVASDIARDSHMSNEGNLAESRRELTDMQTSQSQDLRRVAELMFQYDNAKEKCPQ